MPKVYHRVATASHKFDPASGVKFCCKCDMEKPISEFYKSSSARSGYRVYCTLHDDRTPTKIRKQNLRSKYNLTPEEYQSMVVAQFGLCAICGNSPKNGKALYVDHCHKSGLVRALLCASCNSFLGKMHDDREKLLKFANYLELYSS